MAIDRSEDDTKVYALVGAREHILKTGGFLKVTKWVKHFRAVGSDRKRSYLISFPRRFRKIEPFLSIVRIVSNQQQLQELIDKNKPLVVVVDDKLYSIVKHPRKVRESRVKEKHRKKLVLIADNLANYFRILLKENPRRFREELRRFGK